MVTSTLLLLLPISLAAGVDLFLTLILISTAVLPGWEVIHTPGLEPLRWATLTLLFLLYLMEGGSELFPLPGLIWHNAQLVLRPLAAFLLALTVLEGAGPLITLAAALGAAVTAAFAHVLSWGGKLRRLLSPGGRISPLVQVLAEDTLVLAFLTLAFELPREIFLLSLGLLLVGLLGGRSRHHLVRLGPILLLDRVWGALSRTQWRGRDTLPRWVREGGVARESMGFRGIPCGVEGIPGVRGFRAGWLLDSGGRLFLTFRGLSRTLLLSLHDSRVVGTTRGPISLRGRFQGPRRGRMGTLLAAGSHCAEIP